MVVPKIIKQEAGLSLAVVFAIIGMCVAALVAYGDDREKTNKAISEIMIQQAEMKVEQTQSELMYGDKVATLANKLDRLTDLVREDITRSRTSSRQLGDRVLRLEIGGED